MTDKPLFYRICDVVRITGLSRATIYRLEKAGRFPARRQLTAHAIAWLAADIERWASERPVVGATMDARAAG